MSTWRIVSRWKVFHTEAPFGTVIRCKTSRQAEREVVKRYPGTQVDTVVRMVNKPTWRESARREVRNRSARRVRRVRRWAFGVGVWVLIGSVGAVAAAGFSSLLFGAGAGLLLGVRFGGKVLR